MNKLTIGLKDFISGMLKIKTLLKKSLINEETGFQWG